MNRVFNCLLIFSLISSSVIAGGDDKEGAIVLGGMPGMGGMIVSGQSIVAPGMSFGMMPLIVTHGKKSRNIIWGRRKRRSVTYVIGEK